MTVIARSTVIDMLVAAQGEAFRDFYENVDYGQQAVDRAVEVAARAADPQGAVEEIAAWLQHIDRLDEIPGARIGLPERNVLWDAAETIRHRFGGQ